MLNDNKKLIVEMHYIKQTIQHEIGEQSFTIGRGDTVQVRFKDCSTVSREHLKVEIKEDQILITDLGSRYGSYLNNIRLEAHKPTLYKGEALYLGYKDDKLELKFILPVESKTDKAKTKQLNIKQTKTISSQPEQKELSATHSRVEEKQSIINNMVEQKEKLLLIESIHLLQSELSELQNEKNKYASFQFELKEMEAKEKLISDHLIELHESELLYKKSLAELGGQIKIKEELIKQIQIDIDNMQIKKNEAEIEYKKDESRISQEHSLVKAELVKIENFKLEFQKQSEMLHQELDRIQKKTKLDIDNLEAEGKLKKSTIGREVEELLSKKHSAERELTNLNDKFEDLNKSYRQLNAEIKKSEEKLQLNLDLIQTYQSQLESLTSEKKDLEQSVDNLKSTVKSAQDEADRIIKDAVIESKTTLDQANDKATTILSQAEMSSKSLSDETILKTNSLIENTNKIIQEKEAHNNEYISKLLKQTEDFIKKSKNDWTIEYQKLKTKSNQERDKFFKAWNQELNELKEKESNELQLWKTEEDRRIKEMLANDVFILSKNIATNVLSFYKNEQSIPIHNLLQTLEKNINLSLNQKTTEIGTFNPNLKKGIKTFWLKTTAATVAVALLTFAFIYGPEFMNNKIEIYKAENKKQNETLMKELRIQREKMLALHLDVKSDFQNSYVNNILYNPGYLTMKTDDAIKKLWTVELSKFFFDELLFDNRKVVEFMPIESSMITGLADIYKILNTKNFQPNLLSMKTYEENKITEMWFLLGGKDNWLKLRKFEENFYTKYIQQNSETNRTLASPE